MVIFKIEPDGRPYYEQLRDQVIRAIKSGQLQPGDKLPTLQEISTKFGVSKNTGIRAYQELERAGWVKMSRKTGTLVQPPLSAPQMATGKVNQGMAMIQEGLDLLFEAGTPADNVRAALVRIITDRWSPDYSKTDCIVVLQDDPFNLDTDLADVKQATGLRARWVPFCEVLEFGAWALGDTRRVKAVITPFYRYSQVHTCLNTLSLPVVPISVTTDPTAAQNAEPFNRPGVRVAIIATDAEFFVPLSLAVQQFLYHTEVIGKALLSEVKQVRELVAKADLIVGSYWVTDPRGVSEITMGKPVIPFGTRADPSSLQLVKQIIAEGNPPAASLASQVEMVAHR